MLVLVATTATVATVSFATFLWIESYDDASPDRTPILYTVSPTDSPRDRDQGDLLSLQFGGGLDAIFTATPQPQVARSQTAGAAAGWVTDEHIRLQNRVCDTFPEQQYMCQHVVWAESLGVNTDRCSSLDFVYDSSCWSPTRDCGLMQINEYYHAGRFAAHGWNILVDCFDPEKNLVIAREIWLSQGCTGWSTC